jgi:MFS transporter, PAT family, beta-lactamase induction signal transducer AmpG
MRRWLESLAVYRDRRMLVILGLGFSSGLPLYLVFSTLSLWLKDAGLGVQVIGLFAVTRIPYSFKFLWSPLMDRLPIPGLTSALGRRRSWLLVTQLGLAAAIVQLALSDPASTPELTRWLAIVVAVMAASQDIVVDAYRIDRLPAEKQGAGAAVAVTGYRVGMLASGAGALYLTGYGVSWQTTYLIMAGLVAVGVITTLLCREPEATAPATAPAAGPTGPDPDAPASARVERRVGAAVASHLYQGLIAPFIDLVRRHGLVTVALLVPFALLFKLGDAFASTMSNVFLADIGFTKIEIANIAKTYGLVATILGVMLGGWLVRALGMMRALWIGGLVQMASNLMYTLQAHVGADSWVLAATIGVENLSGGVGDAAFVAYLSSLCNRSYSATQYALLSALAGLVRNVASMFTGGWVEAMGWPDFFLLTAAAAVPGLVMLYALSRWMAAGSSPARARPS